MNEDAVRALVRRFYDDVWNDGHLEVLDEIVADGVHFRGSLGTAVVGRDDLAGYVLGIRQALPDYHCDVELIVADTAAAAARVEFRGTHRGPLMGVEGSGRRIAWAGAAFFKVDGDVFSDIWVLGDLAALRRQLVGPPDA